MEGNEYDFNRICRACKCESVEMRPVFEDVETTGENPRIDEMLMACASIQVITEDGLPSLICHSCLEQLNNAYLFKQQCQNTDLILREYLKTLKSGKDVKPDLLAQNAELADSILLHDIFHNDNDRNEVADLGSDIKPDLEEQAMLSVDEAILVGDIIQFLENNQVLLTCRTCNKRFTTLDGLKCHKRLHTGGMFKCKTCDKEYTRLNHLQRHELSHGRRKVHVCKICNKTLTRFEHLKRHLVIHLKEKPFSCSTCNRGFNRSEHLLNHSRRCKGDRVHICDICNKGFTREDSLEVHKRLHDNKTPVLPTLDNLDNIEQHYHEIDYDGKSIFSDNSDIDGDNDAAECFEPQINIMENTDEAKIEQVANFGNEIYAELDPQDLIEEKTKIESEFCNNEMQNDDGNDPGNDTDSGHSEYLPTKPLMKKRGRGRPRKSSLSSRRSRGRPSLKIKSEPEDYNDTDGEYICSVCNKSFPRLSLLAKHAQKHEGLKLHICTVCNKKFSRSNHLKRHMTSHSELKPFICDICTKSFSRRDHLTQHVKLHSRTQDYECDICKRLFGRADHLAKHQASKHNIGEKIMGEKKFKCTYCMKGFTTEKYRDVHMKGHTGDKKYQCKTCEKAFISKSHLTEHMKFHNDHSKKFLCSECGQRFIRNDYLVIHMRRHRGEKPFKCKYCGKGFPRTTDLTVHERYHTGEKTHLCTICGRGFGRAYNLTVHMRTHTGEKPYQCTYCDAAFAQGNDLKAHVRRHTGERFQCDLCTESFLMGYLLTQHKRTVHGLNVVSNIRRLQPIHKATQHNADEPQPITIPLPTPVIPPTVFSAQIQAHLAVAQLQNQIAHE